jgi:hypothetical protein
MTLGDLVSHYLAFRTASTTVIVVLVYVLVLGATFLTDELGPASVPSQAEQERLGLNLTRAYDDLKNVCPLTAFH